MTTTRYWLPAAAAWLLVGLATVSAAECNKPCFEDNKFPVELPTGFKPDMYSRYACLVDPSLDCRLSHEFPSSSRPKGERGFPANSWDKSKYCYGCYLYFEYCAKKDGSMNTGTLAFVHNSKDPTSDSEHALVMPNQPCRGVEVWEKPECGGEKAWDAALDRYTAKGGKTTEYFKYVVSVNSMKRRTMNQLHLHVGQLASGVKSALKAGHTWAKAKKQKFLIGC